MADWLLLRLPSDPASPLGWCVADSAGRIVMPPQSAPLMQVAALGASRRVCALLPAADVLLTEADVPARAGARVHQVVPFALEEHLAEDIDSLHFAVGKRGADSARTPVAVVARVLLDQWLAAMRAVNLVPECLYAESDLLPLNPGQAVALLADECAVVRPAGGAPVTMPLDALAEALELARPAAADPASERTGSGLILYTGAAEWQRCSRVVEAVRDRFDGIKVQLLSDGPLPLYAQQLPGAAATAINLLQGPYAPTTALAGNLRAWRVAAALLAALVVAHVGGSAAELLTVRHAERKVDTEIEDTFRAAMPGERNATDARRRLEQRLASQGGADQTGLLGALAAVAQARSSAPGTSIQGLNFSKGSLELRLSAANTEVLDHLSQALRASGWDADLTGTSVHGAAYEGSIQLKAH
jgi:general secretion pathway protein L